MEEKFQKIDLSNMSVVVVLIVLCIGLSIVEPAFRTFANMINILQQATVMAVLAVGENLVIFTGCIDISVGSIVGFSGIMMGKIIVEGEMPSLLGIVVALAIGAACGAFNGVMVAKFKLQPMIATLAMMSMARGAALTIANGETITGYPQFVQWIGAGTIPGTNVPVQILFMIVLFIVFYYITKYRKFGRYLYSIGGNEEATRLSGINVKKYKIFAYTLCGLCAAIASVILVGKLNSAQSIAGQDYEMDAIASCVLGGSSLLGGFGNVWGTLFGAIVMVVIRNGLNLLDVSSNLQKLIIGIVILLAVLADSIRHRISAGEK